VIIKKFQKKITPTIIDIVKTPRKRRYVFKKIVLILAMIPAVSMILREGSLVNQIVLFLVMAFIWTEMDAKL